MNVNDIVSWRQGGTWNSRWVFGTVTRVTPKGTVYATEFGRDQETEFRKRGDNYQFGCRLAKPLEVARIKWKRECPDTTHVKVRYPLGADDDAAPTGVVVFDALPLDQVQAAAGELLKIAEWLERMPTQDSVALGTATEH